MRTGRRWVADETDSPRQFSPTPANGRSCSFTTEHAFSISSSDKCAESDTVNVHAKIQCIQCTLFEMASKAQRRKTYKRCSKASSSGRRSPQKHRSSIQSAGDARMSVQGDISESQDVMTECGAATMCGLFPEALINMKVAGVKARRHKLCLFLLLQLTVLAGCFGFLEQSGWAVLAGFFFLLLSLTFKEDPPKYANRMLLLVSLFVIKAFSLFIEVCTEQQEFSIFSFFKHNRQHHRSVRIYVGLIASVTACGMIPTGVSAYALSQYSQRLQDDQILTNKSLSLASAETRTSTPQATRSSTPQV